MSKKTPKELLYLITSNSQHLTNIIHLNQTPNLVTYKKTKPQTICPISVCKTLVQITYLYYSCTLYGENVYVSFQPLFVRRSARTVYEIVLVFYLGSEDQIQTSMSIAQNIGEEFKQICNFRLFYSDKFNTTILPFLYHILNQTAPTPEKNSEHPTFPKLLLANFIKHVKKHIQPHILNNSEYPVIKQLQKTKLFLNYSDILLIYKTSIYYRIKKDKKFIECMKNSKNIFMGKLLYLNQNKNWMMAYKILDRFLLQLTSYQILFLDKSSTKDNVGTNNYSVGGTIKYVQNGKQRQKYEAKFYTTFSNLEQPKQTLKMEQQQTQQKNDYTLSYSIQNFVMQIKYITNLQASSQKMDAISFHCSNVCFKNARISAEPIDFLHTTLGSVQTKKFIAFKVQYRMEKIQEPSRIALMLIEYVTLCTKIFLELIVKKPEKDPTQSIMQYSRRLEHLLRIFIEKSQNFYLNL